MKVFFIVFGLSFSVFSQHLEFKCEKYQPPRSLRNEKKRNNLYHNICRQYKEEIALISFLFNKEKQENLDIKYHSLDLESFQVDLEGTYQIILAGNDNMGLNINKLNHFTWVSPYAKKHFSMQPFWHDASKIFSKKDLQEHHFHLVETYALQLKFLSFLEENTDLQKTWLSINSVIPLTIDIASFARSLDFNKGFFPHDLIIAELVKTLNEVKEIVENLKENLLLEQIKLGFDDLSCQLESIQGKISNQSCVNLHSMFWLKHNKGRRENIKHHIESENSYLKRKISTPNKKN